MWRGKLGGIVRDLAGHLPDGQCVCGACAVFGPRGLDFLSGRLLAMLRFVFRVHKIAWGPRNQQCELLWNLIEQTVGRGSVFVTVACGYFYTGLQPMHTSEKSDSQSDELEQIAAHNIQQPHRAQPHIPIDVHQPTLQQLWPAAPRIQRAAQIRRRRRHRRQPVPVQLQQTHIPDQWRLPATAVQPIHPEHSGSDNSFDSGPDSDTNSSILVPETQLAHRVVAEE